MESKSQAVSYKIWKSRNTVLEMLRDRHIDIPDSDFLDFKTFDETFEDSDEHNFLVLIYEDIVIFWSKYPKIKLCHIQTYVDIIIPQYNKPHVILLIESAITSHSIDVIKSINQNKINIYIEIFKITELLVNRTKHMFVPKHSLCSDKKKKEFLKHSFLKESQIPKIYKKDPIIRYLGGQEGQLVKIIRNSQTFENKKEIFYRLIV